VPDLSVAHDPDPVISMSHLFGLPSYRAEKGFPAEVLYQLLVSSILATLSDHVFYCPYCNEFAGSLFTMEVYYTHKSSIHNC
jgi:hypothetical protein